MRFFFDRCIPVRIARMVDAYEAEHTVRHDSRFHPKTADVEWLAVLAKDDPPWVIVSGDGAILRNNVERSAWRDTGFVFFLLNKAWMGMPFPQYAWRFIKVWPAIVENATSTKHKVFEVGAGKNLKVLPVSF